MLRRTRQCVNAKFRSGGCKVSIAQAARRREENVFFAAPPAALLWDHIALWPERWRPVAVIY